MIGKLIFFFVSLAASCILCYLASVLKASGLKDRRINGLKTMCFTLPFWLILTAVKMVIEIEYLAYAIIAQQICVNITIYMMLWFILHLVESKLADSRRAFFVFLAIPAIDIIMLITNPWHMKYFTSYEPELNRFFLPEGPLFNIRLAVMIIAILYVYTLLIIYVIKNYKNHPILILSGTGAIIPLVFNLLYLYSNIKYDYTALSCMPTVIFFTFACYAPRIRKAREGLFSETLAKIAKSAEIISGTIPEAARFVSREGCLALDTYRIGIWNFDEKSQTLKSIDCFNAYTQEHFIQDDFDLQRSELYKEILLSKKMIVINDTNAPNILQGVMKDYDHNICSILDAPIWIGGRLAGVITAEQDRCTSFPEKREWTAEEQAFVSSLSDLMTIVYTNAEKQILKDAELASRAKSQFITNISHEIRTPMNAVLGMIEIAIRENDLALKNEHLHTVKQAGTHLMSIINDILDFSRIDSGKQEIICEEYSVSSLLDGIINITGLAVADSGIRFAVKADNNIPRMLYGDEAKIRQAIINILDNAVKYTERGSVSFGVYGEITGHDTMNLIFVITDTGIGIKPEEIDLIFSDNSRDESEGKNVLTGMGLGLAISKNFIEAMNGKISVQSEYGEGSTFTISLPQKYHSHEAMAQVRSPENKSVIIFERRDIYADSLAYTVKNLGADCIIVASGTELYNKMENKRFDYLFISFGLYKKNEETIKKFGKDLETIILTEFNEIIHEKNLKTLTMPVYCRVVAEVLNGIYENIVYSAGTESPVKFTAPDARVLIVDDINTNLKVAQGLMMPYNMNIDLCTSGKEAIDIVISSKYDVVFMDHRMPGIDGIEAARKIREWESQNSKRENQTVIIALTANVVLGMKEMFLKNGFNDYLPKPIDIYQLNAVLEKWIPKEKQAGI